MLIDKLIELMQTYNFSLSFNNLKTNKVGAEKVICYLLEISMCGNYYNYTLGRYGIKKISEHAPDLLIELFDTCVDKCINVDDEDEYSRLETIVQYCLHSYLPRFTSIGLASNNKYTVEIAQEYVDGVSSDEDFTSSAIYAALITEYNFWENELKKYLD